MPLTSFLLKSSVVFIFGAAFIASHIALIITVFTVILSSLHFACLLISLSSAIKLVTSASYSVETCGISSQLCAVMFETIFLAIPK